MALYRFEAKIISRSGGRSTVGAASYRTGKCAVAAIAYRTGTTLTDERTGLRFDYSRRAGVLGAEIITPVGAPAWMRDRQRLWNGVEKAEARKDAQLARDFVISLPHELSPEIRVELTRRFAKEQFVSKGYVADIAWHGPDKHGDPRNFHAHLMVPLRRVEGDGFAKKKDRAPGADHPMKKWKAELEGLRIAWANEGADELERAGLMLEAQRFRVGYLTIAKQREAAIERGDLAWADQLDREAETKLGPIAAEMEREGRASHAGADLRAIRGRNTERQALKAEHAAITAQIIDLELERLKRGIMAEPTTATLEQQPEIQTKNYQQLESVDPVSERERLAREWREEQAKLAAEAEREREARRRAEEARAREGELPDARSRYAEALSGYNPRDPYGSLIAAAHKEYAIFRQQYDELRRREASELAKPAGERDPHKIKMAQLDRAIIGNEYMEITEQRNAGISRQIIGPDGERRAAAEGRVSSATRHAEAAKAYGDEARKQREERAKLIERERQRDAQHQAEGSLARRIRDASASIERDHAGRQARREANQPPPEPKQPDYYTAESKKHADAHDKAAGKGEVGDRKQGSMARRIREASSSIEKDHVQRADQSRGRGGGNTR